MKRWAVIHAASGCIVMLSSRQAYPPCPGMIIEEASREITPQTHWWAGSGFALQEIANIVPPAAYAEAGSIVTLAMPDDAWTVLSDGTFSNSPEQQILAGYKVNRFTLAGRYTGVASVTVVMPETAMADLRLERDRLLTASDKYALPDFPIGAPAREAWLAYRQQLREIPEAQPDATLASVEWPIAPN